MNFNLECYLDNSNWKDFFISFVIFLFSGDVIDRSIVDISLDISLGFLRCLVVNIGGSDENMMRFFVSGEL